jgi:hypothetical protein
MPSLLRNPKSLADWLDLGYASRPRLLGRLWRWGVLGAVVLSAWAVTRWLPAGRHAAFQAGPVSAAHTMFGNECGQCHTAPFKVLERLARLNPEVTSVPDSACTRCHSGPTHHETAAGSRTCVSCHIEHRSQAPLARVGDSHCTSCHADLARNDGVEPECARSVTGFTSGRHPEFRLWTEGPPRDPGTIRFSHATHLAADGVFALDDKQQALQGATASADRTPYQPAKSRRVLECQSCHELDATGHYHQPIRYDRHCAACHPITASLTGTWPARSGADAAKAFSEQPVPHPSPRPPGELVRGVIRARLADFVAPQGNKAALSVPAPGSLSPFPGVRRPAPLGAEEHAWLNAQQSEIERQVYDGSGGCRYCHSERAVPERSPSGLPEFARSNIPARWLTWSTFDHKSHQFLGCAECHPGAPGSGSAAEVLLPRIGTCLGCHDARLGQARSDCVGCHPYHDPEGRRAFRGSLKLR